MSTPPLTIPFSTLFASYTATLGTSILFPPGSKAAGLQGQIGVTVLSAPGTLGNWNSIVTAFNGDLSKIASAISYQITDNDPSTHSLGSPTSGYKVTQELTPDVLYLFNSSGWNQSLSGNGGRTAAMARYTKVDNFGQGDCIAHYVSGIVVGSLAGATSFLANPAIGALAVSFLAGTDGTYLNPVEIDLDDNGKDVAGIAFVTNLKRTKNTASLNQWWAGLRVQSTGSKAIDTVVGGRGPANVGVDLSFFTLGTNQAAVTLAAGQRIYLNADPTDASGLSRFPSVTGKAFLTSGTGSPEGAVTAPVGSLYSRTDGGAGTTFYVKESGTGNTGWIGK